MTPEEINAQQIKAREAANAGLCSPAPAGSTPPWNGPRGKPENPTPFKNTDDVIRMHDCPDCKGRGWFLINPFETSPWPSGGYENCCQCQTCVSAKAYWDQHGFLPEELAREMKSNMV
jgi:hypothetical protein